MQWQFLQPNFFSVNLVKLCCGFHKNETHWKVYGLNLKQLQQSKNNINTFKIKDHECKWDFNLHKYIYIYIYFLTITDLINEFLMHWFSLFFLKINFRFIWVLAELPHQTVKNEWSQTHALSLCVLTASSLHWADRKLANHLPPH